MPSIRSRCLPPFMRLLLKRRLYPHVPLWQQRAAIWIWSAFGHLPWGTAVERIELAGRPAERVRPRKLSDEPGDILLLHGGGYCYGGLFEYREFAARLSHASGRPVTVLHYHRAPEHPYPAAVDDAVSAWREMRKSQPAPPHAIVGDSAGGGLALATCLRLRSDDEPLPQQLGLVSPWVDLTQSGETIRSLATADPLISEASLKQCAERYSAGRDCRDPELSPLFGDLGNFPTTLIQVGANEILLDDARRLAERMGHPALLEVTPDFWHVWHLFASLVPESRAAIERLGRFLSAEASSD